MAVQATTGRLIKPKLITTAPVTVAMVDRENKLTPAIIKPLPGLLAGLLVGALLEELLEELLVLTV